MWRRLLKKRKWGSRKIWRLKNGFYDSSVDGEDRENDTSQEDQCQFVDVFDSNKDNYRHEYKATCAIDTHVVEQGINFALLLLCYEDGCLRHNVGLRKGQKRKQRLEKRAEDSLVPLWLDLYAYSDENNGKPHSWQNPK